MTRLKHQSCNTEAAPPSYSSHITRKFSLRLAVQCWQLSGISFQQTSGNKFYPQLPNRNQQGSSAVKERIIHSNNMDQELNPNQSTFTNFNGFTPGINRLLMFASTYTDQTMTLRQSPQLAKKAETKQASLQSVITVQCILSTAGGKGTWRRLTEQS